LRGSDVCDQAATYILERETERGAMFIGDIAFVEGKQHLISGKLNQGIKGPEDAFARYCPLRIRTRLGVLAPLPQWRVSRAARAQNFAVNATKICRPR
jgi:hypothetical protein